MSAKSRPDLRVFPSLDFFLCLECGCTVEYPPTTKPPGYVEELCGRCFREMVDKATTTLADNLAKPLDPDADVRTLAVHLVDVLTTEAPPSLWMQWSESDEELHNLTPHLERKP